ncbi:DNA recombination protein RmuC [Melaminivora sp.]|uniref:DNA recombination protein RmuC n=1 Tax=Melaminivora sp. TaxID=1933032 RepID=UPI0028AA1BFF|nr:DNA recombination protein RmuC [Melaminivora sp.]
METFLVPALLLLAIGLLLVLVLRRQPAQLPPEWLQQLKALETAVQATQLAVARNDGALAGMDQQLRGFTQATQALLDERLAQGRADAAAARRELTEALAAFRTELAQTAQSLNDGSHRSREAIAESTQLFGQRIQERFDALGLATQGTFDSLKGDIHTQLAAMALALKEQLAGNTRQLVELSASSQQGAEALRTALNERLAAIQSDNAAKLEEMRRTVDEKLHATLEQRLGESFKLVSDRLEQVHKGLGEMQTLAGSVGDLKRVMTNVKTRGTWGEMQLGLIIDNVLTPEQYAKNVKTMPGSEDLVEFAIRLPGRNDEHPVWLPIDSKYPVEHYQRLQDAHDAADKALMQSAGSAFEMSIRVEAKKISAKYVSPPHTTDFAVLYLPSEGLFAEVMRRPGLVEAVQNDCRVVITGPANLAAMLNSLQMGFKTLAIEKRSSEVWGVLGQVKTEFAKFGEVVEATRKSIDAAAKRFEQVGVRTRAIQRKLRDVQELPAPAEPAAGQVLASALLEAGIDAAEAETEAEDA